MGAEEGYDFLRIFIFLRTQKAIVEDPVIGFAVFVFGTQKFQGRIYQLKHLIAAVNALSALFVSTYTCFHRLNTCTNYFKTFYVED